jgi:hypothetical protein
MRQELSHADQVAALGAAYEHYVARLRMVTRLRCRRRDRNSPAYAAELALARTLTEEAYAQWRALAEPHLSAARRADDEGGRA